MQVRLWVELAWVGWGEPNVEGFSDTVATAVDEMMKSVVGEDPSRISYIWQKLHLSESDLAKLKRVFDSADRDKSGELNLYEFLMHMDKTFFFSPGTPNRAGQTGEERFASMFAHPRSAINEARLVREFRRSIGALETHLGKA